MQLVEAVILFLVGLVAGVIFTIVDVYTVGAAAFLTHVSLWILINVLFGANVRRRRAATLGAIPLNLGLIEMYYLTLSYTYVGLARSHMPVLALLSIVGALVALVAWTAKNERSLFALLLTAFVVVGTLVACVLAHDAPTTFDVCCVVIMAYVLVFMRSRRFDVVRAERAPELVTAGVSVVEPVLPQSTGIDAGAAVGQGSLGTQGRPALHEQPAARRERKLSSSSRRKPARRSRASQDAGSSTSAAQERRSASSSQRASQKPRPKRKPTQAKKQESTRPRPSRKASGSSAGTSAATSKGTRAAGSTGTRRGTGKATSKAASKTTPKTTTKGTGRSSRQAGGISSSVSPSTGKRAASSSSTKRAQTSTAVRQKPTRRTGGPMPTTDVIHTRSGSSRRPQGSNREGSRGSKGSGSSNNARPRTRARKRTR